MTYQFFLSQLGRQTHTLTTPACRFGALLLESTGKLACTQIEFVRSCGEVGLEQVHGALGATDPFGLQAFLAAQQRLAEELNARLARGTRSLVTVGELFGADVQKLAKESVGLLAGVGQPQVA